MACDTRRSNERQTLQERIAEIKETISFFDELIRKRKITIKVGPQGAISFTGITDSERRGITDGCIYRRIMATGTALARAEIAKAEQLAGRSVDKSVIAQGVHSHDGGHSWHNGH